MAYSAFNSQGPQVSVSLFGNAAAQGANIGNAIPSVASSIIQGVKGGLDYVQNYEAKDIANQNNQAIADYNQARGDNAEALIAADLQRNELINKEAELNFQIKQATFDNDLLIKKQEAENSLIQKKNEKMYLDQESEITSIMTSGDANAIANSATDGRFGAYWTKNKEAQKQIILQNKNRYQGDQKAIAENILYSEVDEAIRKAAAAATFKGDKGTPSEKKYEEAFSKSPIPAIQSTLADPRQRVNVITRGVLVPMESIDIAEDGSYTQRKGVVDLGGKEGTYAMVMDGKVVGQNISSAQQQEHNKYMQGVASGAIDPTLTQLYLADAPARSSVFAPPPAALENPLKTPEKEKELAAEREKLVKEGVAQGPQQAKPYEGRSNVTGLERTMDSLATTEFGKEASQNYVKKKEELKKDIGKIKDKGLEYLNKASEAVFGVPEAKANDMQAYQNQQPVDVSKIEPLYKLSDLPEKERKVVREANTVLNKVSKLPVVVKNENLLRQIVPNIPGVDGVNLVKAVAAVESGGDIKAKSPTGATGLMQLTDAAAQDAGVTNKYDPDQNLLGGAVYLSKMLARFDYNVTNALLAYNGGPSIIAKAISEVGNDTADILDYLKRRARRNKNAYPNLDKIKEMENYPEKVLTHLASIKYNTTSDVA